MVKSASVLFADDGEELASELCDSLDIAGVCELDVKELKLQENLQTLDSVAGEKHILVVVSKNFLFLLQKAISIERKLEELCGVSGARVLTVMDRVSRDLLAEAPIWLTRLRVLHMQDFGDNRDSVAKAVHAFWTASAVDSLSMDCLAPEALPRVPSFDPLVREEKEVNAELLRCPEVPQEPLF